jgi:hypothetical protein
MENGSIIIDEEMCKKAIEERINSKQTQEARDKLLEIQEKGRHYYCTEFFLMSNIKKMDKIEAVLDAVYGKKEDVIELIQQEKWGKASRFGDHICYGAVINNANWIWDQIKELDIKDVDKYNSCSWGGLAMAIHYGSAFPERKEAISNIKLFFLQYFEKNKIKIKI